MSVRDFLLGKPIPDEKAESEKLGSVEGVAVLGLDALASAAYGPEAALTALMILGGGGIRLIAPITAAIIAVLIVVCLSYRQTIAAYPDGGGAYTVVRENVSERASLLAAALREAIDRGRTSARRGTARARAARRVAEHRA
jgi:amino acid transporter